jgi:hypothetical protein
VIYRRGKWLYGAFVLVARDAARQFALVCGKRPRGRNGSWRPLALRWRHRRKRHENAPMGNAARGSQVFWFPQFHFHYATHKNDRGRRDRVGARAPALEVSETRVITDRDWTRVRDAAITPSASRGDRALRFFHLHHGSRSQRDAGLANPPRSLPTSGHSIVPPRPGRVFRSLRPFRSAQSLRSRNDAGVFNTPRSSRIGGHSIVAPAASRARPFQFVRILEIAHAPAPSEERKPFATPSRIWNHWLQTSRARPPAPGDLANSRAGRKPLPVQLNHAEELVWRRATRSLPQVAETELRQEFSDSHERPAWRSFQSQEAEHVPARFEQPAAQQITTLDPRLVERLTNDVIRRMEQRVRIERERRGL